MSKLISPLSISDVTEAYAAYCSLPTFKRDDRSPVSKREFTKRHKAAASTRNAPVIREAKGETKVDLAHIIATATAAALAELGLSDTGEAVASSEFRTRTPKDEIPADAARNAVLWALNTEGFLSLDTDGGNAAITQEDGTSLLSATFGPLS